MTEKSFLIIDSLIELKSSGVMFNFEITPFFKARAGISKARIKITAHKIFLTRIKFTLLFK